MPLLGTNITLRQNDLGLFDSLPLAVINKDARLNSNDLDTNFALLYNGVNSKLSLTGGTITGNLTINGVLQFPSKNISLTGDLSGSASFNGTSDVIITATIQPNSVALGTDTTGNYIATGAVSGNGITGSASGEGSTFTINSNATNANTPSTIVFRDASGNFSAGIITASLNGNANTASTLQTARIINLSGDVTGSTSFDGSGDVVITTTIQPNSVALGTDTTGNYIASGAVSGIGLSGSATGEGSTFTVTSNATSANTTGTLVARDASGNFSAGTITATLDGNASTATSAESASSLRYAGSYNVFGLEAYFLNASFCKLGSIRSPTDGVTIPVGGYSQYYLFETGIAVFNLNTSATLEVLVQIGSDYEISKQTVFVKNLSTDAPAFIFFMSDFSTNTPVTGETLLSINQNTVYEIEITRFPRFSSSFDAAQYGSSRVRVIRSYTV